METLELKIINRLNKLKLTDKNDTVTLPFIHKSNGESYMLGGYNEVPFNLDSKVIQVTMDNKRLFFSLIKF